MRKPSLATLGILFLSVLPVFLWWPVQPSFIRFSDFASVMATVGQLLGLVGAALFALNLFLSARLKIFERVFKGLNKLYESHRFFGELALVLLLAHPLFLLPRYAGGTWIGALKFLFFGSSTAIAYGTLALGLMLLLVAMSLWFRPKYNIWKWTHQFLGFAFFIGALHVYLIPSDTSVNGPLRFYMLGLAALGLTAFLYRSVLGRFLVPRWTYRVKELRPLHSDVVQILMEPVGKRMPFIAGQYIFIRFKDQKVSGEVHPFSISSSQEDPLLSIIVKNLGDYTQLLPQLSAGSLAKIEGPYGIFSYTRSLSKKMIWVAGGIGITPFLSMAATLKPEEGYKVDLYYCVKDEGEAVAMDVIQKAMDRLGAAFKLIPFPSNSCGRITADVMEQRSGALAERDFFLCAPPAMITALRTQLLAKGISLEHIHSEEFSF